MVKETKTAIYCTFCRESLHPNERKATVDGKTYHVHHVKHHKGQPKKVEFAPMQAVQ